MAEHLDTELVPVFIDDRSGLLCYMTDDFVPCPKDQATMAKVVFDDGGSAFYSILGPSDEPDAS